MLVLNVNGESFWCVPFSPDGSRIAASGGDGILRVWDAETGLELAALRGHTGFVPEVAFSCDGKGILTAGIDGTARVWYRRRPEYWWGVAWLPEFWIACASGLMLVLIAACRSRSSPGPTTPSAQEKVGAEGKTGAAPGGEDGP